MRSYLWRSAVVGGVLLCLAAPALLAENLTIEAENYEQRLDLGGYPIQSLPLLGCSGGYILYGLDAPGEWTEYEVSASVLGTYTLAIKCRGTFNRHYRLNVVLTPEGGGNPQTVEFSFLGQGFG